MGQNYEKIRTERKRVIFLQRCEMHLTFLYIKNYSSVYKWMPALSNIENNLESVSQRGNRGQLNTPLHRRGQALR